MLKSSGTIRVSFPDFRALCQLYLNQDVPLYPKILSRESGEQEYSENMHRCVFEYDFLIDCLTHCGLQDVQYWDPAEEGFVKDSSFDQINGVSTRLNLKARLGRKGLTKFLKRRAR